jgi:hypothetical protein
MANLKQDLINKVNNEKYFEELELVRLASDPNMNYKEKIDNMSTVLEKIALLNAQAGGIEQYFRDEAPADAPQEQQKPEAQQVPVPQQAPAPQVHQGQSHGE